ncbi:MAG: endolytic transglycosylase MltG [Candidatus Berkiella sp.]
MLPKITAICLTIIVSLCLATYIELRFAHAPLMLGNVEHTLNIKRGMSVKSVAALLKEKNILSGIQSKQFLLWVKVNKADKKLKAGTYLLSGKLTPDQLMNKLIIGDVAQYAITIIEGQTVSDFLEKLKQHPAIFQTVEKLNEKEILALLEAPYPYLEGIFFPDTYYFPAQTQDITLLKLAYQTMQRHLTKAWEKRAETLAVHTPYEALILASIIEKEGQLSVERPLISGVFHRRLAKKMRLQADPTVLYALGNKTKNITKADLKMDNPFNTYVYPHLPPSPIALPGLDAIEAALHPDDSEALYFVAKGDGSHYFSANLNEHNKAVQKYQLQQPVQGVLSE